jgi:hypothetical protein
LLDTDISHFHFPRFQFWHLKWTVNFYKDSFMIFHLTAYIIIYSFTIYFISYFID